MPRIRLLTSVAGDGPVQGSTGDVLVVDAATAKAWADGVRAERVIEREVPIERAVTRGGNAGPA
jgi:hypothetical protein